MSTMEKFARRVGAGEDATTEFKAHFNQEVLVSLNAFANTRGGRVYIGVSDNQKIAGVEVLAETVKNLNHQLSLSEISDLYLKTVNSSWDYYLDHNHILDDLSGKKIEKLMDTINHVQKRITVENDTTRFLMKHELAREGRPTHAAFLLFMKNDSVLTGIQAGRFKSKTMIIDSLSIAGDLFQEVTTILNFIRKHLMVEYIITGNAQREERFNYPLEAIREIVINMIVHRNYQDSGDSIIKIFDDRIEFFNPGNLPEELTVEQLLSDDYAPKSRNILINQIFKEAAIVEKYGSGISRIVKTCQEHGGCSVTFENEQHGFKVVLRTDIPENDGVRDKNVPVNRLDRLESSFNKYMVNRYRRVVDLITRNGKITIPAIAVACQIDDKTIKRDLAKLKDANIIRRVGPDKNRHWEVLASAEAKLVAIEKLEPSIYSRYKQIITLMLEDSKITIVMIAEITSLDIKMIKRDIAKLKEAAIIEREGFWKINL